MILYWYGISLPFSGSRPYLYIFNESCHNSFCREHYGEGLGHSDSSDSGGMLCIVSVLVVGGIVQMYFLFLLAMWSSRRMEESSRCQWEVAR